MRDLMKRLDRLEQLSGATSNLPIVFFCFAGHHKDQADPATISCDGEALTRTPGESMIDFRERAAAHFEPQRLPSCGLILRIDGGDPCAS